MPDRRRALRRTSTNAPDPAARALEESAGFDVVALTTALPLHGPGVHVERDVSAT